MSTKTAARSGTKSSEAAAALGPLGKAKLRYLGVSAQKARLVVDQIRGQQVDSAFGFLRHCKKAVAADILKLLRSAVANTESGPQGAMLDTADLYVSLAMVDGGPSLKRIQPAPMGRAFPILKRQCHVTLELAARNRK